MDCAEHLVDDSSFSLAGVVRIDEESETRVYLRRAREMCCEFLWRGSDRVLVHGDDERARRLSAFSPVFFAGRAPSIATFAQKARYMW